MKVELRTVLTVWVDGEPVPQGSKTVMPVGRRCHACGNAPTRAVNANDKQLKAWRKKVEAAAKLAHGNRPPLDGELWISCEFVFPRLKGHYTSKGVRKSSAPHFKSTTPDQDKLERAVRDALEAAEIIVNDSRIVGQYGMPCKRYGDHPGVQIQIAVPVSTQETA